MHGEGTHRTPQGQARTRLTLALILGGFAVGFAAWTFDYAEGTSYLRDDPLACANCHIMQPQFDSWQGASHHTVATCVDCHLPRDFAARYLSKLENGWNHSRAFTLLDFAEPIAITRKNRRILQDNCVRCHSELVHGILRMSTDRENTTQCVHCHSDVGHGEPVGLGGPFRSDEIPKGVR